ncbi:hypothetical protein Hanom_Chr07g00593471 [Helianthus anomalus]
MLYIHTHILHKQFHIISLATFHMPLFEDQKMWLLKGMKLYIHEMTGECYDPGNEPWRTCCIRVMII